MQVQIRVAACIVLFALGGCLQDPAGPESPVGAEAATLEASADAAILRPGMVAHSYSQGPPGLEPGGGCTANFLFRSANNGTYYFGSAAHCFDEELGASVGLGLSGTQFLGQGTLVYHSFAADAVDPKAFQEQCNTNPLLGLTDGRLCWNDFALIALDANNSALAHPALRVLGGPINGSASASVGSSALTVGASYYRAGNGLPDGRLGRVTDVGTWRLQAYFAVAGTPGDSGSPVVDETGRALGVLTTFNYAPPGSNGVALLAPMLEAASGHGWHVDVVTEADFAGLP